MTTKKRHEVTCSNCRKRSKIFANGGGPQIWECPHCHTPNHHKPR